MRLMTWNIEWMNKWFVGGGTVAWKPDGGTIKEVKKLAERVAKVIQAVDPDVLTVQEGPSDRQEMALFVSDCLKNADGKPAFDILGGLDGGAQKPYILVKRGGAMTNPTLASDDLSLALFDEWEADIDADAGLELYDYTRDPVIVDGKLKDTGEDIRIITLHTKSKYVHNGSAMWNDPNRRQQFIELALMARRRISAEAMHTRRYLDLLCEKSPDLHVAITGDFNDGPGYDFFERLYLTHGVADIMQGSLFRPGWQYKHVLIGNVPVNELFTALFYDFVDDIDRKLLLDHILISPSLQNRFKNATIAHSEFEAQVLTSYAVGSRDRSPSDHRPVVVDITSSLQ